MYKPEVRMNARCPSFGSPVEHLYPLIDKEGGVEVWYRGRWHLATLKKAHSYWKGCQAVLLAERETVRGDRKETPVMREFDYEEVRCE